MKHFINIRNAIIWIASSMLVFTLSYWLFGGWDNISWPYRIAWIAAAFVGVLGAMASVDQLFFKKKEPPNSMQKINQTVVDGSVEDSTVITGDNAQVVIQQMEKSYSALHQLPPPPADFTGRDQEFNDLMKMVESESVIISGLHGMGGVGKTALALKLAEALKSKYPDAQIYIDLKGASDKPLTTHEVMAHVAHSYQLEAKIPESEAELHGLYLSILEDQKALLLFDNASNAAQLEPLLPPKSCLLLVTSRQHFSLPGLLPINLDVLTEDQAVELITKIAPRAGPQAGEIARLCGCLPLALLTAASALVRQANLSAQDLVHRLQDAHQRLKLTGMEASLQVSYDLLEDSLQEKWRLLAVFPDHFDGSAAAWIWQVEADAAQDALGELLARSLLDYNPASQRYKLHDLTHLFVQQQGKPEETQQAMKRHSAFYLNVLTVLDHLYKGGLDYLSAGLWLFDLEWPNIQSGQAWAAGQAAKDKDAARLCCNYPNAGVYYLNLRLHPLEWIVWLEAAMKAAQELNDRVAEVSHLGNIGIGYATLGELHRSIEYFEQALQIDQELGDRRGESAALSNLGIAYNNLGEPHRALEYLEQALQIDRELGDRRGEGNALGGLGCVYKDLGEPRKAIEYLEQNLQIAREICDRRGESNALGSLGHVYSMLGELRKAIKYYEQTMKIAHEIGDRQGEGTALGSLGLAYANIGEQGRAIEFYEQWLKIAQAIGNRQGESTALGSLGLAYANLGNPRQAIEYYEKQLKICYEIGDQRNEGNVLGNLGLAYFNLGNPRQAIEYYEQHLKIARDINDRRGEGNALGNLGLAYFVLGNPRRAIEYYEQHLEIAREIGDRQGEALECWNYGLALELLGDCARAVELMQVQINYLRSIGHPDAEKHSAYLEEVKKKAQAHQ